MRVNPKDGRCRSCNGELNIVDVSDATMSVECEACGEFYDVETDAFNDGGMTYYVGFLSEMKADEDAA